MTSRKPQGFGHSDHRQSGSVAGALLAGLALAVALGLTALYLVIFPFRPYFQPPELSDSPLIDELIAAVDPAEVGALQQHILGLGSRLSGQPAALQTAELLENAFREAGLEVFTHDFRSAVPVTQRRGFAVREAGGGFREAGVEVFPFMPNYLQPVVTPGGGVVGELVLLDEQTLRERESFDDVIGLIDARSGAYDEGYGFDWTRYAQLGVRALIIASPEGFESINWTRVGTVQGGIVGSLPVNFPRVAATAAIFDHVGREVRLDVKVAWANVPARTVIGRVRSPQPANEAIFLTSPYEAVGQLPDKAYGASEAMQAAYFARLARGFGASREALNRDVVLIAYGGSFNAAEGLNHLLRLARLNYGNLVGRPPDETDSYRMLPVVENQRRNERRSADVTAIRNLIREPGFFDELPAAAEAIGGLSSARRGFLDEQTDVVVKTITIELNEVSLQKRIAMEALGERIDAGHPAYLDFQQSRERFNALNTATGVPLLNLFRTHWPRLLEHDFPARLRERFDELHAFHEREAVRFAQERALVGLLESYRQFLVLRPYFAASPNGPGSESVILTPPQSEIAAGAQEKHALLTQVALSGAAEGSVRVDPLNRQSWPRASALLGDALDPGQNNWWHYKGYEYYAFINTGGNEAFQRRADPLVHDWMTRPEALGGTFATLAEFLFTLGEGASTFQPKLIQEFSIRSFSGRVMGSGIGQSVVPNHPMGGAVVAGRPMEGGNTHAFPGYYRNPFLIADPYGRFENIETAADFGVSWRIFARGYAPVAALFNEEGLIDWIKDEGEEGQRLFKSTNLAWSDNLRNVTIVMFRAAPVAIFDLNNPQTMADYASLRMVTAEGLSEFSRQIVFYDQGAYQFFLEPDRRFFALFLDGTPENENVHRPRAFAMNVEETPPAELTHPTRALGYLVADRPVLDRVPWRIAGSMLHANGLRLDLQNRFRMADDRLNLYHERALELAAAAEEPGQPYQEARKLARSSVVFSTLNHPVLQQNINEAVLGILWYLFLMVPFIFFFEKLVFCYADTRKQVAAQVAIFLVCFALLRLLHPAFEMVRSSLMILLGFIIILISGGITFLFSSKFKENLAELRKKAGKVEAAEVNKFGVMGSAFMLGLNNMHRRKVRTGLTCATLVLLTFVMISFTSVENDLVEENVALGSAGYQGLLIRKADFLPTSTQEAFALQGEFGDRYHVARRGMLVAVPDDQRTAQDKPEIFLASTGADGVVRQTSVWSYLKFEPTEPLREQIRLLPGGSWFTEADLRLPRPPVMIPQRIALALNIAPEDVAAGVASVEIGGVLHPVRGIFDPESLLATRDLNGLDLLPYDIEFVPSPTSTPAGVMVPENAERIPPDRLIILPFVPTEFTVLGTNEIISSVAIAMPGVPFREASQTIETFLMQMGVPVYYGLDGVAYRGLIARQATMAGLVDLIIPLLIAGLTVLNTMKGSVYERRDEIFVYNAVGIAPRYVFFMFIAEAFVYAVVGSVLGYLLSQGAGRILTELGLTGGLNMTYTSITTIYASWTIMAAVFISTWFPARQAMEIATPAEEAGWSIPDPEEDELSFDLPFNFRHRGRFAIVAFFHRFLREHGEGSAGAFFAGMPEVYLSNDPGHPGGKLPCITATTWLKPFDLGVSQQVTIDLPIDAVTGLYKGRIRIERLSGTRESWIRLNRAFIRTLRRQFLHWRAVPEADRDEMFEETRQLLRENLTRSNREHGFPMEAVR